MGGLKGWMGGGEAMQCRCYVDAEISSLPLVELREMAVLRLNERPRSVSQVEHGVHPEIPQSRYPEPSPTAKDR